MRVSILALSVWLFASEPADYFSGCQQQCTAGKHQQAQDEWRLPASGHAPFRRSHE
jgi:hypothetical protein